MFITGYLYILYDIYICMYTIHIRASPYSHHHVIYHITDDIYIIHTYIIYYI